MKKYIIALLVLVPLSLNAQWEILNEGVKGNAINMDFVNENVGWILRSEDEMLKTIDGGQTWYPLSTSQNLSFAMIDFLNESVGWAFGTDNIIYKTENGGLNWSVKKIPGPQDWWWYSSIQVIDENNVYVVGCTKIFKTSDNGVTWSEISPTGAIRVYEQVHFLTPQIGMVLGFVWDTGPMIIRTTNGGSSWSQKSFFAMRGLSNFQFVNESLGYFTTVNQADENLIFHTTNSGYSWAVKSICAFRIGICQFINSDTAYAIMSDSISTNIIMKSTDGGVTWQNQNATFYFYQQPYEFPAMNLNTIYFNKPNNGLILGSIDYNSIIFYNTYDDGVNWTLKNLAYPFNDIHFFSNNNGIVFGGIERRWGHSMIYKGEIFSTIDGGETWEVDFRTEGDFRSSSFIDDYTGYCLSQSQIYKTSDSGINWISLYENNPDSIGYYWLGNDLYAYNENRIYAAGLYCDSVCGAMILGTTNGGVSWEQVFKDPTIQWPGLNSICFSDTIGWAVGEQGIIVKYTPNNGWVKIPSITDFPLRKVVYSDENNLWIMGGYQNENDIQSILLKTTNGGDSWDSNSSLNYLINDLWFLNSLHGWAVGYDTTNNGVILETLDGGNNWTKKVDNLIGPLNSIFIKDNYAWAVGEYGLILRTTDAGATWIDDKNDKIYPTEFMLEQNYPNPFNPNTVISYQLPVASKVTLKVYDVLGREVVTLVNEEQPAGGYKVEFNPVSIIKHLPAGRQGQASGIYFYQLKAGAHTSTKKMLLLK